MVSKPQCSALYFDAISLTTHMQGKEMDRYGRVQLTKGVQVGTR